MILKSRVLRRVQDLQQSSRRIAMETGAELVDFIQHKDGILGAGFANSLNNISGERADISAAVPSDLRLVVDTAKTLAHEFPVHGSSDALPEGRLSDAWRTDKT